MKRKDKEQLHENHETFTQIAYEQGNLLPDRYVFVLTNLCNLKCSFCFQRRNALKDAMAASDWISVAKQIPEYARVTFTGGEPLLFKGFEDVFSFVAERFDCNIISNGLLLTEEKIDFMLSYPKFKVLSLSIDNIGNTIRDVTPKQWDYLKRMILYFQNKRDELNPKCVFDIKTMILDGTAEQLFDMYRYFVEELRCDTHSFNILKGSPLQHADFNYEFNDMLKESRAQVYGKFEIIKRQLKSVHKYNMQHHKTSFLHPKIISLTTPEKFTNLDYLNHEFHDKGMYKPCKYPWSSVHINADGTLFPCMTIPMGNVKKMKLPDIIFGNNFVRFKDVIKEEGTVQGCNRCGWLKLKIS